MLRTKFDAKTRSDWKLCPPETWHVSDFVVMLQLRNFSNLPHKCGRGKWSLIVDPGLPKALADPRDNALVLWAALPPIGRKLAAEQSHASFATKIHKIPHFLAHLHFLAREGWRPALASELAVADGPWHQMPRKKLDANFGKYWKFYSSFFVCSLPLCTPSVV